MAPVVVKRLHDKINVNSCVHHLLVETKSCVHRLLVTTSSPGYNERCWRHTVRPIKLHATTMYIATIKKRYFDVMLLQLLLFGFC